MKIYRDRVEVGKSFSAPATATFCWQQSRESFSVWWADNDTIMCSYIIERAGHDCPPGRLLQSVVMPDGHHVFHLVRLD